ncbi:MAG: arsenate reductase ArsC [Rhodobacteraceae bacterium]|nr:arsenate reductase ArsC [Paracoccaceae bacterium]
MNILVLCTGNSARSILLEAFLNHYGRERLRAWSAGSRPAGAVHPQALDLLSDEGIATDGLRSKSWDEFGREGAPRMDMVITVCGSAAGETCPIWPGAPLRAHWGVNDPAAAAGPDQPAAFRAAFDRLSRRGQALLGLPFETLSPDELSDALRNIGDIE